jgi:hypothetical protein
MISQISNVNTTLIYHNAPSKVFATTYALDTRSTAENLNEVALLGDRKHLGSCSE